MQRFNLELAAALTADDTIIVESAQRASALRAAFAAEQIATGRVAWRTPKAASFYVWARQMLGVQHEDMHAATPRVLTDREEWALMREFAHHAAYDYEFAARRALASQFRSATVLLDEWQLRSRVPQLQHWPESELLRTGLAWLEDRYRELGASPMRNQLERLQRLAVPTLRTIAPGPTPLQAVTLARLGARHVTSGHAPGEARVATCKSVEDECDAVAVWAREQLITNPARRLLIVAPDLSERRTRLERALSQALEPGRWLQRDDGSRAFAIEGGRVLSSFPLVTAALASLRLLTRPLPFDSVSAWLRSPFLAAPSAAERARLDVVLRESGRLDLSWQALATLAQHHRAPAGGAVLATRLHDANSLLPHGKAAPVTWAQAFEKALQALGWPGEQSLGSDAQQTRARWQELLAEFAGLGHVWQALDARQAVDALGEIAEQVRFDVASADVPVLVTEALHNPGIAYDGIWVLGLDSDTWPPAPTPHPLIPLSWQLDAGIPQASSERLYQAAAEMLTTWRHHTAQLVLSSPHTRDEHECTASALLASYPVYVPNDRGPPLALSLRGHPKFEEIADYRGVPLEHGASAKHGVRIFDLQARCPFRAYGELRLGAAPLEKPRAGVDPRDRGIWLHEALAEFWRSIGGSAALATLDDAALEHKAAQCVAVARSNTQPRWSGAASLHSIAREALRLRDLLLAGARLERERDAFEVGATEHSVSARFSGVEFRFKIDRIDRINGGIAIIDYKSGADKSIKWLLARPEAPQLLAYLAALPDETVRAIALQFLSRKSARFRGAGASQGILPRVTVPGIHSRKKLAEDEARLLWQQATQQWRTQIAGLAQEYVSGDARVSPSALEVCGQCHLTALCRRAELVLEEDAEIDSQRAAAELEDSDE